MGEKIFDGIGKSNKDKPPEDLKVNLKGNEIENEENVDLEKNNKSVSDKIVAQNKRLLIVLLILLFLFLVGLIILYMMSTGGKYYFGLF